MGPPRPPNKSKTTFDWNGGSGGNQGNGGNNGGNGGNNRGFGVDG